MIKKSFSMEFEGLHIENIVRSEMGYELRKEYGEKSDLVASDRTPKNKLGNEFADLSKVVQVPIGQDSNYNYEDKSLKHYKKMKERVHTSSEIDINKHEDPKKFN